MRQVYSNIHPREIADKSVKGNLEKAVNMALLVESEAVSKNTKTFNANRYAAKNNIKDYQQLREQVRRLKEYSIEEQPKLLKELENSINQNGGTFYFAKTAEDASKYITEICKKHNAKLVVKAKSITSEEIKLNHYLQEAEIEVAETDLAEFILQISGEQPSHIVAPAIHRSKERISALFRNNFKTNLPLTTGEDLTKFAKDILRNKFLTADIGISGANVIAADTGTLLLVESEGNIRMVTQAPPVHIVVAGVEKVIPHRKDLWKFIELLAPSATGQNLTSYTHIIKPPLKIHPFSFDGRKKKEREFYLVVIDNGRTSMREDSVLREALYCIRCSACMNVCANFQAVGGHAFGGETSPGGIGGSWEAGTGNLDKAIFSDLCTGCSRCVTECPVLIDIPWLNENLRYRLNKKNIPEKLLNIIAATLPFENDEKNASLQKKIFANYYFIANWGSKFPSLLNTISDSGIIKNIAEKILKIDKRRSLPKFNSNTLLKQCEKHSQNISRANVKNKVLLFADLFTNFSRPSAGIATVKVFNKLGIEVIISNVGNEGRDSLSQGFLSTTKNRALETANYLQKYIDDGLDVIVVEPSILALFRKDYKHFLDEKLFNKLKHNCYDPIEYLMKIFDKYKLSVKDFFNLNPGLKKSRIFFHSHCQQRSIYSEKPTIDFFKKLGFNLTTSTVECCGMAGSFGYKKQYYDLSVKVGKELVEQIEDAVNDTTDFIILSSGVSCHQQINDLTNISTIHPIELLHKCLK